jgi:hypothetical protein
MRKPKTTVQPLTAEFSDAELGDERLSKRLVRLAADLGEAPSESFPKALSGVAALEGAYRFFSNSKVTLDAVLAPHIASTADRCAARERVLVIHDTTEFEFSGEERRDGLGRLLRPGQGFFGHFSMCVSADGLREPLGVVSLQTIFRHAPPATKRQRDRKPRGESQRWRDGVENAERCLPASVRAIHVMDREGDSFPLFAAIHCAGRDFVIRSAHDRALDGSVHKLRDAANRAPTVVERDVRLSPRRGHAAPKSKQFPARRERTARLAIGATEVKVTRNERNSKDLPRTITLNLVHVLEVAPPRGEAPVEWILLTTLPVDSPDALAFVVDTYRARWLIEEYFKALKTGCQYEKRQLETAHALLNALGVLAPVAWRMLLLRHLARLDARRPATDALTNTQVAVLKAIAKKPLPAEPTARDALLAVAALGGHLKNNGEPGWQVLGRGFRDLLLAELGWQARGGPSGCDQS